MPQLSSVEYKSCGTKVQFFSRSKAKSEGKKTTRKYVLSTYQCAFCTERLGVPIWHNGRNPGFVTSKRGRKFIEAAHRKSGS